MKINFYKKCFAILSIILDIAISYLCLYLVVLLRFQSNFTLSIFKSHLIVFTPLIIFTIFLYFLNNLYDYRLQLKDTKFISYFGSIQLIALILGIIYFYILPLGLTPKTNLLLF